MIGARTQVPLPALRGTGPLFPDLSIEGSGASFQILVEVKIGATFHSYDQDGRTLLQPEAYIESWRSASDPRPADHRRVATLTREGPGYQADSQDEWRGRDATWEEVRDLLSGLINQGRLGAEVATVADDYRAAIEERILWTRPDPARVEAVLEAGRPLLEAVTRRIAELGGDMRLGRVTRAADFVSRYLHFTAPTGEKLCLWIFVTAAGGVCNLHGLGDALCIEPRIDSDNEIRGDWIEQWSVSGSPRARRSRAGPAFGDTSNWMSWPRAEIPKLRRRW